MSATNAYLGIDVSKLTLDLAVRSDDRIAAQRQFRNTPTVVAKLMEFITGGGRTVRAVLEPTSRFHVRLRDALAADPSCEVMAVNPARAHYFLAAFGQRAKTDRIDAQGLAQLAQSLNGQFRPFVTPSATVQELQLLGRQVLALVAQRAQCKNRLKSFDPNEPVHVRVIASLKVTIAMLKQQANDLVATMVELIMAYDRLCSWFASSFQIKGIGQQSAAQLIAETAVLPGDMTARQWTASAGLDPRARQSGQSNPPQRISRMGNRYLRRVLYMAAINTTQFDPDVKRYYEYLQSLGKPKKLALTVIMRKLLQAFWVMQHRDQPFIARKSFSVPAK